MTFRKAIPRALLQVIGCCLAVLALASAGSAAGAAASAVQAMPAIGIIGTGHIGGTLAALWSKAGYRLMISSRHPSALESLAHSLGPQVRVGTPQAAAAFGEVVVISVPYGALPQVGRDLAHELAG